MDSLATEAIQGMNPVMNSASKENLLQYEWSKHDEMAWQQLLQEINTLDYTVDIIGSQGMGPRRSPAVRKALYIQNGMIPEYGTALMQTPGGRQKILSPHQATRRYCQLRRHRKSNPSRKRNFTAMT